MIFHNLFIIRIKISENKSIHIPEKWNIFHSYRKLHTRNRNLLRLPEIKNQNKIRTFVHHEEKSAKRDSSGS